MCNKVIYHRFNKLPLIVRSFCFQNNGWIVGGAAKYLLGIYTDPPRDYDILIPLEHWDKACKTIPLGSTTNSFGGIKLRVDGVEVDIWGDSLSNFIETQNTWPNYAVNLNQFTQLVFDRQVTYSDIGEK